MTKQYINSILALGEAYAQHKGLAFSTVATYAVGDARLAERLLTGRVTLRNISRFVQCVVAIAGPTSWSGTSEISNVLPAEGARSGIVRRTGQWGNRSENEPGADGSLARV